MFSESPTEYPDTQRVQVVGLRDPVTEILKEAEPILDGAPRVGQCTSKKLLTMNLWS